MSATAPMNTAVVSPCPEVLLDVLCKHRPKHRPRGMKLRRAAAICAVLEVFPYGTPVVRDGSSFCLVQTGDAISLTEDGVVLGTSRLPLTVNHRRSHRDQRERRDDPETQSQPGERPEVA